jgi:hypothetical protein
MTFSLPEDVAQYLNDKAKGEKSAYIASLIRKDMEAKVVCTDFDKFGTSATGASEACPTCPKRSDCWQEWLKSQLI